MVTKQDLVSVLFKDGLMLVGGSTLTLSFLGAFNPAHAIIGALGQLVAIGAKKVSLYNEKKQVSKEPLWYWIISILLGAVLAFVATPYLTEKLGVNELFVSGALGSVAQYTFDFINAFKDSILKTLNNEKGSE